MEATLLYTCESWTLTKGDERRPAAFQRKAYQRLLRVSWKDRKTNEWVMGEVTRHCVKVQPFNEVIRERKFRYFGHVVRGGGLARQVMEGGIEGRRRRGRPKTTWMTNCR